MTDQNSVIVDRTRLERSVCWTMDDDTYANELTLLKARYELKEQKLCQLRILADRGRDFVSFFKPISSSLILRREKAVSSIAVRVFQQV